MVGGWERMWMELNVIARRDGLGQAVQALLQSIGDGGAYRKMNLAGESDVVDVDLRGLTAEQLERRVWVGDVVLGAKGTRTWTFEEIRQAREVIARVRGRRGLQPAELRLAADEPQLFGVGSYHELIQNLVGAAALPDLKDGEGALAWRFGGVVSQIMRDWGGDTQERAARAIIQKLESRKKGDMSWADIRDGVAEFLKNEWGWELGKMEWSRFWQAIEGLVKVQDCQGAVAHLPWELQDEYREWVMGILEEGRVTRSFLAGLADWVNECEFDDYAVGGVATTVENLLSTAFGFRFVAPVQIIPRLAKFGVAVEQKWGGRMVRQLFEHQGQIAGPYFGEDKWRFAWRDACDLCMECWRVNPDVHIGFAKSDGVRFGEMSQVFDRNDNTWIWFVGSEAWLLVPVDQYRNVLPIWLATARNRQTVPFEITVGQVPGVGNTTWLKFPVGEGVTMANARSVELTLIIGDDELPRFV